MDALRGSNQIGWAGAGGGGASAEVEQHGDGVREEGLDSIGEPRERSSRKYPGRQHHKGAQSRERPWNENETKRKQALVGLAGSSEIALDQAPIV